VTSVYSILLYEPSWVSVNAIHVLKARSTGLKEPADEEAGDGKRYDEADNAEDEEDGDGKRYDEAGNAEDNTEDEEVGDGKGYDEADNAEDEEDEEDEEDDEEQDDDDDADDDDEMQLKHEASNWRKWSVINISTFLCSNGM
jgi:hypothetical protein